MKIQVMRIDGRTEVINLVGTIEVHEPADPKNQSRLHVKAIGTDHFFRNDGCYDGWGMSFSAEIPEDKDPMEEMRPTIEAIERDREVWPKAGEPGKEQG